MAILKMIFGWLLGWIWGKGEDIAVRNEERRGDQEAGHRAGAADGINDMVQARQKEIKEEKREPSISDLDDIFRARP